MPDFVVSLAACTLLLTKPMKTIGSLMVAIAMMLFTSPKSEFAKPSVVDSAVKPEPTIKMKIATVGPLGLPRDHFRVGEELLVEITMTNTSNEPVYVCVSNPLYQDVPTLTKDGQAVQYMSWQAYEQSYSEKNGVCYKESLPEPALLPPGEPTLVDWFVLSDDASLVSYGWYDPLPAGSYQLSVKRRISCCDGPTVESNKISFDIQ
jgi:hypothetical protein